MADEGRACWFPEGPSNHGNVFEPESWPVNDLDDFAGGHLGIIRPTYDHFYLFIAYRNLLGLPLSIADVDRMRRHDPCWRSRANGFHGYYPREEKSYVEAVSKWIEQREKVAPRRQSGAKELSSYLYRSFQTCNADAFRNATAVLVSRLAQYGQSTDVQDWIRAQDSVFAACDGPAAQPEPVTKSAPRWLQLDREYQIAAALFYAGSYDQAVKAFDAIAATSDSPWRQIAPYLAARTIIRSATTAQKYREPLDDQKLTEADSRLNKILRNPLEPEFRKDVERLLQFVQIRTRPAAALEQIERRLTTRVMPESIGQDVTDFWVAYQKGDGVNAPGPFSRWLTAMRSGADFSAAFAEWRASGSLPWLVVALQEAESEPTAELNELLTDAAKVPVKSPAYLTARYHLARLGDSRNAHRTISGVLKLPATTLTRQDANAFRSLGLEKATSIADFARYAPRETSMTIGGTPPNVDADSADIINRSLPLDSMAQILFAQRLPDQFRRELTRVVWVRAFVLNRWDLIRKLAPQIKVMVPESTGLIDEMVEEKDSATRKAVGAMVLARYPGMVGNMTSQITYTKDLGEIAMANMHRSMSQDGSRENWWCGFPLDVYYARKGVRPIDPPQPPPTFLSPKEVAALMAERRRLESIPNATDYLSKIVMEWARKNPRDSSLPRALQMLIRSSRGGCVHDAPSAAMFRHLHKYFPNDPWTKKTRVHY